MTLNQITKVKGPGIHTQANIVSNSISLGGIATASNFKTGTTNVHNVGVEAAGINVLGADTPIGTGATIYDVGGAVFTGVVTATSFSGTLTGNVAGDATGLTGTPDIAVRNITSVGATFTGNVSIGGTLTYEDVTNIDSVGIITARDGINLTGGNITLADRPDGNSQNLFFGTGAKAAAYHDGTNFTVINNTGHTYIGIGAANKDLMLYAQSTGNIILQRNTGHKYFEGVGSDGTAKIYHNTNEKIRTTPTGAVVTGILTATGQVNLESAGSYIKSNQLKFNPSGAAYIDHGVTGQSLNFRMSNSSALDTTAVTIKSDGTVGINVTNPDSTFKLDLNGKLRVGSGSAGSHVMWSRAGLTAELVIGVDGYGNAVNNEATIQSGTGRPLVFMTNGGERLRIASDGKVAIGGNYTNTSSFGRQVLIDGTLGLNNDSGNVGMGFHSGTSNCYGYMGTGDWAVTGGTTEDFGIAAKGNLIFGTSSGGWSEKLRIASDGKVQIGTAPVTTSGLLNVKGNVVLDDGTNARITLQADGTSTNQILSTTTNFGSYCNMKYQAADHIFLYGGSELLRITSAGKIGIGDIQPKGKLDIDASGIDAAGDFDDPNDYAIVIRNSSTSNEGNGIAFTNDGGQHVGGAIIHIDKGSNNLGDLAFYTAATSSNPEERLRIKSDGGMRLIKNGGNANFTISRNESVTSTDQPIGVIDFANNTQHTVNARIMGKTRGTSNVGGDLVVETRADGGSLIENFRITGDGHFGTGGVTPTTQSGKVFHLHGGSNQQRFHMTNNTTGSGATDGFEIIVEQSANVRIRNFEAGNLYFDTGGSNNERIRILSDGKVGINQGASYNPLTSLDIRHHNGVSGGSGGLSTVVTICAGRNSNRGLEIKTGRPTTGNQNDAGVYYNAKDTESGAYHAQHVWQLGGGNAMVLGQNGQNHLGINENYPAYPLDISYTDNNTWQNGSIGNGVEIHNKSTTAGTYAGIHLYATGNGANAAASHISCVHTANGTGDMSFANRHAAGGHAERMRLHSDGILKVPQGVDTQGNGGASFYSPHNTGYVGTQWTEQGAAFVFYMGELASSSTTNATSNYVNLYTSHHWGDFPRLIIWAHHRYYQCSFTTWTFGCYGGSNPSHSLTQTESWGGHNGTHSTDNAGSISVNHAGTVATYSGSPVSRYELTMNNTGTYGYTRWYIGVLRSGRGLYTSASSTSNIDSTTSSGGCIHLKTMSNAQMGPITYLTA